jgi:putative ABC transport system permease protein
MVMAWEHVIRPPRPTKVMKFMYKNAVFGTQTMVEPGWMDVPMDVRFVVIGYEPGGIGGPPNLIAGREIEAGHYEIVADAKTGFQLGERVRLGNHDYTVVGLTKNMVGYTADPVVYATLDDAQEILFEPDPDLLRNRRERLRQQFTRMAAVGPRLAEPLARRAAAVAENTAFANTIAVKLEPGASPEAVAGEIARWKRLEVYTPARQSNLQLMGANRLILFQLSLFRILVILISGIIIGLIVYTFTLDKVKEIAVLKLLGTQGRRVYRMILEQAVLMGVLGTLLGAVLILATQQYFPRRVEVTYGDIGQMLVIMTAVTALASMLAVRRATKVDARSVLGS